MPITTSLLNAIANNMELSLRISLGFRWTQLLLQLCDITKVVSMTLPVFICLLLASNENGHCKRVIISEMKLQSRNAM